MATIVRQRLLRTGDLEFTEKTASDVDQYLCVVDERLTKIEMAELFLANGDNPRPRGNVKALSDGYMICDKIKCSQLANQGLIWRVDVYWKEIESDQPQQQSTPTPNSGSIDPEDWTPTWQRRTVVVQVPATRAYYRGGYSAGVAEDWLAADEAANGKASMVNSALQPFEPTQEHRRRYHVYSLRWIRAIVPATLQLAEGKLNSQDFTITLGLNSYTWTEETALIDSVNLSKIRWGNLNLVEIAVEIIVDPEGWNWLIKDQGTARRQALGDPDKYGNTISSPPPAHKPPFIAIYDEANKAIQDPIRLDGDGQPASATQPTVYGDWMDFDTVPFDTIVLLKELGV